MARKYPGRDRVMAIDDARDYLWRREFVRVEPRFPCLSPVDIHAIGLPGPHQKPRKLPLTMQGRCRKCENCLLHKRQLWTARAVDEIDVARRTWFGTLTVAPEHRFKHRVEADLAALRKRREPLSSLSHADHFQYLCRPLLREVTKFLKRLRKSHSFRYLLVTEAHASGDPHVHLLLHEQGEPVGKRALESAWRLGFSHWRLVDRDSRAAVYVCKYLNKGAQTRVRASLRYGQAHKVGIATEAAKQVVEAASRTPDV